ncbi:hypothetical protein PICMEDRAFT_30079 [Pichia membranifaciens NRRL Y-2026]|uniref:SWR1-complex protein 4 n=1 Tax=Pichia membranifaciens NRRL Y-2026 TaxID=763406 RepID=A0A1E3NR79_9ASCO|nr:hypothetical protein PICMEDRAFT_30079 [Pichia membranifaciens NRRL Y-2026]ODQ48586.1 hypothetical protein PICMEDRAFT_30079 [Pichia membranifaciens NRRL Y-2026]
MSDILDVLNIKSFPQKKGKEGNQQPQQTSSESRQIYTPDDYATSTKRRKLSAMNRELYNLIGSNVPSLAIDTASVANAGSGKKFKEKLVNTKKNAPWKHIGFKNSARPDGLVLYHWTKSDNEIELDPNEYRYAKYNTSLDIPTFTEEEYEEAMKEDEEKVEETIQKEDSENVEGAASQDLEVGERTWTYDETKFLFDLCSTFDMRWAVIYDRYQDKYTGRTIEDLKVQMYTISAHLLEKRGNLNDSALIKALRSFNKDKELERKYYLTKLIHRAPTEIAEEESLVIEARKFELAAKKMLLERAQLLQLLDSPQSSASVQQYLTSQGLTQLYNSLMAADKSKKRKAEVPVAPLLGPNAIPHTQHLQIGNKRRSNAGQNSVGSNGGAGNGKATVSSSSSNGVKPPSKLSEVQQLLQKNLTAEELEVYGIEIHNERIQPGVHVRSQKIASFKPSVQAKVHEILGQLGLSTKPTMPTGPVSKKFDDLLYKISHLVDLKKQSDKLLAEIELIKRQKGVL